MAVVGAGIVGVAHAIFLARLGLKVVVFERDPRPLGASVRNFGLLSTAVLPPGDLRKLALRSRKSWVDMIARLDAWSGTAGSLFLAHSEVEMACVQEYVELLRQHGWNGKTVTKEDAIQICPNARTDTLLGGAYGTENIVIDPLESILKMIDYLQRDCGVAFHFNTTVVGVEDGYVGADHRMVKANHVLLCTGDDFQTLFPQEYAEEQFTKVKLQMLRAAPTQGTWHLGPAISGGLSAYRHGTLAITPSFGEFKTYIEAKYPEQVRWGVHALCSQYKNGDLVIGDSLEEAGGEPTFSRDHLDRLIWNYLGELIDTSQLEITERWMGTYTKAREGFVSVREIRPKVTAVHISGGLGLTLSFGVAQDVVEKLWGPMAVSRN